MWSIWKKAIKLSITTGIFYTNIENYIRTKNYIQNELARKEYFIKYTESRKYYEFFKYNNLLFPWWMPFPSDFMTVMSSAIIDIFRDTTPYLKEVEPDWTYLWKDVYTWWPIVKNLFNTTSNKNMLIIWWTWSWKTFYTQMITSLTLKDKIIIVDPSWTTKKIKSVFPNVTILNIKEWNFSPIYVDKEFLKRVWISYEEQIWKSIEFIFELIKVFDKWL